MYLFLRDSKVNGEINKRKKRRRKRDTEPSNHIWTGLTLGVFNETDTWSWSDGTDVNLDVLYWVGQTHPIDCLRAQIW